MGLKFLQCTNLEVQNEKLKEDLFEARQALLDQSNAMHELKNKLMVQNLQLKEKDKTISEAKAQEKKHVHEIIENVIEKINQQVIALNMELKHKMECLKEPLEEEAQEKLELNRNDKALV